MYSLSLPAFSTGKTLEDKPCILITGRSRWLIKISFLAEVKTVYVLSGISQ